MVFIIVQQYLIYDVEWNVNNLIVQLKFMIKVQKFNYNFGISSHIMWQAYKYNQNSCDFSLSYVQLLSYLQLSCEKNLNTN